MSTPDAATTEAIALLHETPLIDGHNDFPFMIRGWYLSQINNHDFNPQDMPIAHTDFLRLKSGGVSAQFWSAYVPCPQQNKNDEFGTKIHLESLRQTLQQIDLIHTLIERHPSVLGFATSATEVWDVFRSGRIASLIGVEGLHQIANSASVLRMLFRLGVRYITLTHGSNNLYADSAVCWTEHTAFLAMNAEEMNADSFEDSSFSGTWRALGRGKRDFIRNEPNRNVSNTFVALWEATCVIVSILMPGDRIIDLSHTSDAVQKQALSLSRAPVIFSHSSCSSLCANRRNSTDEVLDLLKANGGVIMISFLRDCTDETPDTGATLARVVDHVLHAGERIGYEHVGIGSDFDGMMKGPDGLEDVSKFPALVVDLLRRLPKDAVRNILGRNILRIMEEVERVSKHMKLEKNPPLCDKIEPIWGDDIRKQVIDIRLR